MTEKFVCLSHECDFCSENEDEAYDHVTKGRDHIVVGVYKENENIKCHQLGEELRPEDHDHMHEAEEEGDF